MVESKGCQVAAECYIKIYFGGGKRALLENRQAWRGRRRQKMDQGAMGLGMLGRRQVTPRSANNLVWLHDGFRKESGQGRVWADPQTEIRRRTEKGGSG